MWCAGVTFAAACLLWLFSGRAADAPPSAVNPDFLQLLFAAESKEQRVSLLAQSNTTVSTELVRQINAASDQRAKAGAFDDAQRINNIAFELAETSKDLSLAGLCLRARGVLHFERAEYPAAQADYEQALKLFRQCGDPHREAEVHNNLANVFTRLARYEMAIREFETALLLAREFDDRPLESKVLNNLGLVERRMGQFTNALAHIEASLAIEIGLTNRLGVAECQGNLAEVQLLLGNYDEARRLQNLSRQGYRAEGDKSGEVSVLSDWGVMLEMTGHYREALAVDEQVLKAQGEIGDKSGEALTLNNIGALHLAVGRCPQALEMFQASKRLATEIGDRATVAMNLQNIGEAHQLTGNYAAALEALRASLEIERDTGNRSGLAQSLGALANLYTMTGLLEEAKAQFEALLKEFRELGMKLEEAATLQNLASVFQLMNQTGKARELFTESLNLKRQLEDRAGAALTLASLGTLELEAGQLDNARSRFEASRTLAKEIGDRAGEARALVGLGDVARARGQPEVALEFYQRAVAITTAIEEEEIEGNAYLGIGQAHQAQRHWPQATTAYQQAITLIERTRSTIGEPSQAATFFAGHTRPYYLLATCQLAQEQIEAAWQSAERAKARVLADMLARGHVDVAKALTSDERLRKRELEERISYANLALRNLREQTNSSLGSVSEVHQRLAIARRDYEAFHRELYRNHPQLAVHHGEAAAPGLDALRRLVADDRVAILEFLVDEQQTTVFVISRRAAFDPLRKVNHLPPATGSNPESAERRPPDLSRPSSPSSSVVIKRALKGGARYTLGAGALLTSPLKVEAYELMVGRADLEKLVRDLHERMVSRSLRLPLPEARQLYDLLIAPVASDLAGKTVVGIVPDGVLWEVPFAALCDPTGKYLVETHAVFYVPSVTALLSMRELAETRHRPPPTAPAPSASLLVMANPDFGPARKVQTALLGEFDEIPGTAQQAKAIAALYGKAAAVYQGAEATEERVKRECGQFRLLHFATHGIYDAASPLYSGILLAKGGGEDGFWEAREIMEADLQADLVVLSACQTGRGKIQSGEGIWGLAWALFVAGSPANLLTQWEVADASTADLMVSFYRHLQPGFRASPSTLNNQPSTVSKAESLRQAQLEMLRDKRWSHPFHWAPFVLIGDWR